VGRISGREKEERREQDQSIYESIIKPTKCCLKNGRGGDLKEYNRRRELVQSTSYKSMEIPNENPLIQLMYTNIKRTFTRKILL
jgi:hypothetical protein